MASYNVSHLAILYQKDPVQFLNTLRYDMLTLAGMIIRCPLMTQNKIKDTKGGTHSLIAFQREVIPLVTAVRKIVSEMGDRISNNQPINHSYVRYFYKRLTAIIDRIDRIYASTDIKIEREIISLMGHNDFFNYYKMPVERMKQLLKVFSKAITLNETGFR
ncbi:MAG: hypothetical protein AAF633_23205 [Chloroflexota bacterium]